MQADSPIAAPSTISASQVLGSIFWAFTIVVSIYYAGVKNKEVPVWAQINKLRDAFALDVVFSIILLVGFNPFLEPDSDFIDKHQGQFSHSTIWFSSI